MAALAPGQNAPLSGGAVSVTATSEADLIALVLSGNGKVAGDDDMVFFNQPRTAGVSLQGSTLAVDPAALRPGAEKVLLVASVDAPGLPFGSATVVDGPTSWSFTPQGTTTETAVVLVELYLRNGAWKVRAVGQGYSDGLAGLARDYGVDVDEPPPAEVPGPPPAPATAPPAPAASPVSFVKGADRLPLAMQALLGERISLVKVSLEKRRAAGLKMRVIGVLDVSGSTIPLFKKGVFARAVERIMPVAATLDDDAEMQMFAMGSRCVRLDDLQVGDLPRWIDTYCRKRPSVAGGANNEADALETITRYVRTQDQSVPTLVLFFHDGGVTDKRGVEAAVRAAVPEAAFWQFIGVGNARFGILEKLDTLTGRAVDNTGFFQVRDLDAMSDAVLYDALLAEAPGWVRSLYPQGHPARAAVG